MATGLLTPEWPAFLSLLSAAFLPFWPMIHMRFDEEHNPIWGKIDRVLPWLPGAFIGLALLFDIIAHLTYNTGHQRVIARIDADMSIFSRLAVSLTGWTSWALLLMLGLGLHLAVTATVLDEGGDIAGDSHRMHDGVLILFGIFWIMLLFALFPSDPFPSVEGFVIPEEVPFPPSLWNVMLMAPTTLLAGWLIGFGILHLADRGVDQSRHADFECLRQEDVATRLPLGEAESLSGLFLPGRDRQKAAPDDLRHIGGSEEEKCDLDARQTVDRQVGRDEQREHHRGKEEHADQGHAANHFDEGDARPANGALRRSASECEEDCQRKGADHRDTRKQQCNRKAAPLFHRHIGKACKPAAQQKDCGCNRSKPCKAEAAAPKSRRER